MQTDIGRLSEHVDRMLNEACIKHKKGFYLRILDSRVEDDWIHLFVQPDRPGISAEEYVQILADVETQAEDEFPNANLLLVPVAPEDAEGSRLRVPVVGGKHVGRKRPQAKGKVR